MMTLTSLDFQTLTINLALFIPRLLEAIVIVFLFWILARMLGNILKRMLGQRRMSPDLIELMVQVISIAAIIFGIVTALGTIGIDTGAMIAGLGLTGFALGFAFKDVISNFLAGFLVLLHEPFRRGDQIRVADQHGRVVEVNLRYTVLDGGDRRILIPNAFLLTNMVIIEHGGNPDEGTQVD